MYLRSFPRHLPTTQSSPPLVLVYVCVVLSVSFSHQPRRSKCVVLHCLYRYIFAHTYIRMLNGTSMGEACWGWIELGSPLQHVCVIVNLRLAVCFYCLLLHTYVHDVHTYVHVNVYTHIHTVSLYTCIRTYCGYMCSTNTRWHN